MGSPGQGDEGCNTAFREGLQKGSVICRPQGASPTLPRGTEQMP